uniref:Chitin-binding type-2 domain-containing protein n=1 Tax=Romanomermis culicivorax TaxID=13658 RepID=A0A915IMK8_ROMCU
MYENADQNYLFQNWDQRHIRPINEPYGPADVQASPQMAPALPPTPAFCSTRTRGAYFQIKPGHRCPTEFRYCNGTSADNGHIFYCDEGFFVDEQFSQCRERPECKLDRFEADERSLLASQLCVGKQDGIYEMGACEPDFVLCTSNQGAVLPCEEGTAYSSALQLCVPRVRHSQCNQGQAMIANDLSLQLPENLCSSSPRPSVFGFYGCHQFFFYCSIDGRPLSQSCESEGEAFDAVYNRCIPRAIHSLCPEYTPQPMTQGFQPGQAMDMRWFAPNDAEAVADDLLQQSGLQQQCTVNGEFRPHPVTCRKFLRCDHGRYVSFNCPATTVFVPQISVCDHARNHPECV